MVVWAWVEQRITSIATASGIIGGSGGGSATTAVSGIWGAGGGRWNVGIAGIALAATIVISSRRGTLKSPWSRRKRKRPLTQLQWESLFTTEGRLQDGGVKFLKKVRSGGVEHDIRSIVWPFLLGVFDLNSSEAERLTARVEKRKDYMKLRNCHLVQKPSAANDNKVMDVTPANDDKITDVSAANDDKVMDVTPGNDDKIMNVSVANDDNVVDVTRDSKDEISILNDENGSVPSDDKLGVSSPSNSGPLDGSFEKSLDEKVSDLCTSTTDADEKSVITNVANSELNADSSDGESSVEGGYESMEFPVALNGENTTISKMVDNSLDAMEEADRAIEDTQQYPRMDSLEDSVVTNRKPEDFVTWQRIIRLDAIRANDEWVAYSPKQAEVSLDEACQRAEAVGLKDYDHLDACRIYHAARLVAILEAYAIYDQEVGYCQGMSDLLAPIIAIIEEDYEAFWCFVGFMRKARHNFRLDEVGIRRQLNIVAKIIKSKDSHLYKHLQKLQADDCFFVYRMVVVLFRRELDFEQTMNLWEALWADQAALRAGFNKSGWGKIRMRAPPTEDLLLYAIAASVLQKRKLIIERFSSMEEIMKECNNMAGTLDVWKLLDDAHDLVVTLHDKIL